MAYCSAGRARSARSCHARELVQVWPLPRHGTTPPEVRRAPPPSLSTFLLGCLASTHNVHALAPVVSVSAIHLTGLLDSLAPAQLVVLRNGFRARLTHEDKLLQSALTHLEEFVAATADLPPKQAVG
jgi:hypothetical protein